MKILILGGSYFFGRVFVEYAKKSHDLTVLNRGTYPLKDQKVRQYVLNRHDVEGIGELQPEEYDMVIDFCGYRQGDISGFIGNYRGKVKQYIFVSTVDVYERQTGTVKDEAAPYEYRPIPGEAGEYIGGKISLEKELMKCAELYQIPYTIVRPAILYGRYNYAPRESYYARSIAEGKAVEYPVDASGLFQFVYVDDAVKMLEVLCGNEKAYNECFNFCSDEIVDYHKFFDILKQEAGEKPKIRDIRLSEITGQYFPFPLTKNETELYEGKKICEYTGLKYTDFVSSMSETVRYFIDIFKK
ncbi:MAG: NAD-dependent epimerase/dehydratase family protein [Dorea sp.]|nr:NAD-dependent epimerase/dehydratase family protein [Dorea sp.]